MKRISIRQYVEWLTLVPLLLLAIVLGAYFLHDRYRDMDANLKERSELLAHQLATGSEFGVFSHNLYFLNNLAQETLKQQGVLGVVILDHASERLVETGDVAGLTIQPDASPQQAVTSRNNSPDSHSGSPGEFVVSIQKPWHEDEANLWIYHPIIPAQVSPDILTIDQAEIHQTGAVILKVDKLLTSDLKAQLLWATIGTSALFLLFSFILVHWASRRITRPVSQLSDAVQRIGEGHLDTRIHMASSITELTQLESGINLMAAELQRETTTLQQKMEDATRMAAIAFESNVSMMITDAEGIILQVNKAFSDATGYTAEEAIGRKPSILHSGHHDNAFYNAMWDALKRESTWQGEIWNRNKDGSVYPKWLTVTAISDASGRVTHYVGSHIDISERKAAEQEIQNLAFYDPLTKLPNRRLLTDRLRQALASSTRSGLRGALLFIDLDNFKTLNDTLGHDVGDLLLQQVAERLKSCVREHDTVARQGGDEFVVILEELSENETEAATQTETVANKVLAMLNRPYKLGSYNHHSSPSIGAVLFENHQQTQEELLKQADIAMYQAKNEGRNTVRFFDPEMQNSINARAELERELYKALADGRFEIHYQLQVDTARHKFGAEALLRLIHPERGPIMPAEFIELAEESGLILPIGNWVLDKVCEQLKIWSANPRTHNMSASVNVSALQFHQPDFEAQVQDALERHGVNPELLTLELTESLLLENVDETVQTMNTLSNLGIKFALDDFGTSYSSLQYLKRLPFSHLKIDRSFINDLTSSTSDKAIVRAVIAMAKSLELEVVAEGVETEEQMLLLMDKGCTSFQGYLFGMPALAGDFEVMLMRFSYF